MPLPSNGESISAAGRGPDPIGDLFPDAAACGGHGEFEMYRSGDWLLGRARLPGGAELERSTRHLYRQLIEATRRHHLVRVWNDVPAINEMCEDGLENYRVFCRARSLAFEHAFGSGFARRAPAASAVGCDERLLSVVFAAYRHPVRRVENPRQVPAYEYPAEHGPRAPTFARATTVQMTDGTRAVFISGTAAIRGHASVAPGSTGPQLTCTIENLREVSRACGLGADLGAGRCAARYARIYVRHTEDLPEARATFEGQLWQPWEHARYQRADICRRELNVEIEMSLIGARVRD